MLARRNSSRKGERHNAFAALFGAPLSKGSVRSLEVGHVDMWRDCPPDDATLGVSVNNMKNAVPVVNFDWRRDENLRFQQTKRHVHSPSPTRFNATERVRSEHKTGRCSKSVIRDSLSFRQTESNGRRVEERIEIIELTGASSAAPRRSASPVRAATPIPTPANDNGGWHPLDAA